MYDHEEGVCQEGVIIIDKEGILVHSMTTSLGYTDTALNTLDLVTTLSQAETYSKFTKVPLPSHHLMTIFKGKEEVTSSAEKVVEFSL